LAKKDLTETALDTMTWMGEYGGYRFFACGDEITVYKHKDGTYWCTEQDSEHYFVF
jgi:hypothetical protein